MHLSTSKLPQGSRKEKGNYEVVRGSKRNPFLFIFAVRRSSEAAGVHGWRA